MNTEVMSPSFRYSNDKHKSPLVEVEVIDSETKVLSSESDHTLNLATSNTLNYHNNEEK